MEAFGKQNICIWIHYLNEIAWCGLHFPPVRTFIFKELQSSWGDNTFSAGSGGEWKAQ